MFKATNILHRNIETVGKVMGWKQYPLIKTENGYYSTWENVDKYDIEEIFEKTGIQCKISKNKTLLVPEYTDFKSGMASNYLISINYSGEHLPRRYVVNNVTELQVVRMTYMHLLGCGILEEDSYSDMAEYYLEEYGEVISTIKMKSLIDEFSQSEDLVEFIFDCNTLKEIYSYD